MGTKPKRLRTQITRSRAGAGGMGGMLMMIIGVLAVIGLVLYIDQQTGIIGIVPQSGFDTGPGGVYVGSLTPTLSHRDSIQPTTLYNEGAHITTTFYTANDVSTGNTTWISEAADGGLVDMEVVGSVGATLILDITKSLQSTYLTSYAYTNFDSDVNIEHIFTVDFRSLPARIAGQTSQDLPITLVWYNHQMTTGAVNEPSEAFVVNVGNSQNNTQVMRIRFTWANFDRAGLLRNIEIIFNNTATNPYTIDKVELPFRGQTVSFAQADMAELIGTNVTYRKDFAASRGDAVSGWFMNTETGGVLYRDVIIHITWVFEENESIVINVRLHFWDDDEIQQRAQAEAAFHDEGPLA